jgi:hypothetical protein
LKRHRRTPREPLKPRGKLRGVAEAQVRGYGFYGGIACAEHQPGGFHPAALVVAAGGVLPA